MQVVLVIFTKIANKLHEIFTRVFSLEMCLTLTPQDNFQESFNKTQKSVPNLNFGFKQLTRILRKTLFFSQSTSSNQTEFLQGVRFLTFCRVFWNVSDILL